jgi:hypothetical protein
MTLKAGSNSNSRRSPGEWLYNVAGGSKEQASSASAGTWQPEDGEGEQQLKAEGEQQHVHHMQQASDCWLDTTGVHSAGLHTDAHSSQ